MKIGDELWDMHYGSTFAGLMAKNVVHLATDELHPGEISVRLNGKLYRIRGVIEWIDVTNPNIEPYTNHFWRHLSSVMRQANRNQYTNKLLVVMGEAGPLYEGDWFVAGYSYDGRRCGVCQIREVT